MKQETDVTIILDRSGSMESIASDVVGGFNRFLADQRAEAGACRLTLVQFDNEYEVVYAGRPIGEAPLLTADTFQPRGSTALLDAIGRTIEATGARLRELPEAERPDRVLVVIITDGEENSSMTHTREQVFNAIAVQKDVYKWAFLFMAANQDAIAEGDKVGIGAAQSRNFDANGPSFQVASIAMSRAVSAFRSTGDAAFSEQDPTPSAAPAQAQALKKRQVH